MVQTGQRRVQRRLEKYRRHPRRGECEVKDCHGWQQEEQQSKQYGSQKQLVQVVIA